MRSLSERRPRLAVSVSGLLRLSDNRESLRREKLSSEIKVLTFFDLLLDNVYYELLCRNEMPISSWPCIAVFFLIFLVPRIK